MVDDEVVTRELGFADGLAWLAQMAVLLASDAGAGITGVGAAELFMYPYWCVEKGYARFVGPHEPGPEWIARARGWIRVMHVDILCSLVIYTMATVAFYLGRAGFSTPLVPAVIRKRLRII